MTSFFQSRVFIAAAMLLLLGAAQCVMACDLRGDERAPVHKSCHQDSQPTTAAPCAHLEFAEVSLMAAVPPPLFVSPARIDSPRQFAWRPAIAAPPDRTLLLPLRI